MFIPEPDLDFLPIPDLGVKKAPDPGSGSATLAIDIFIKMVIRGVFRGTLLQVKRSALDPDQCGLPKKPGSAQK
jgi:hypothetical protein